MSDLISAFAACNYRDSPISTQREGKVKARHYRDAKLPWSPRGNETTGEGVEGGGGEGEEPSGGERRIRLAITTQWSAERKFR